MYLKILVPLLAYLLGNLNFGILVSRVFFKKDIRLFGSKNPGTTNAFRTMGKTAGFFVLFADALKGTAAVWVAQLLFKGEGELWPALAGVCVMLGHIYPVVFKFKGGKGIATAAGVNAMLQFPVLVTLLLGPFAILLATVKYMSVATLACAVLLPVVSLAWNGWEFGPLFWMSLLQGAIAVFAHRSNIKRLIDGTENKLFQKKKAEPEQTNT